jgi:putative N6-adenine-specific DNA methylase
MEKLFAVCAPGLEPYTRQELNLLLGGSLQAALASPSSNGVAEKPVNALPTDDSGGIELQGELDAIYRLNLHLRTASRVLVRFSEFHAAAFSELLRKARILAWERFISPGQPVAIRVTCHQSRLYHQAAVARELAKAIGERLGKPSPLLKFDENLETQLIIARLVNNECMLSIDSSGALLHRRGYRLETAKAPLRETLAAAMLLASDWEAASPMLDPFCGSGTIPIEAALLRRGMPPGVQRRFPFMNWPSFNRTDWEALLSESRLRLHTDIPKILASDRDAGAIEISRANAERAGVAEEIEFSHRAVSAIEPVGTGWVVTNPPYGLRVSPTHDLRNLYAQFGKVLRLKCPYWRVAILCSDLRLLQNTGLRLDTSLAWVNGGVPVRLARGTVPG